MEMPHTYDGVISRHLSRKERRVPTEEETPLVIEPSTSSDRGFLEEFLQHHSAQIHTDLARHGAILLRGFGIDSIGDFERVILSIRGMRGIDDMLLREAGRALVNGARFVFHTNTLVKTGGTLNLGGFHTENYYSPEVPRYIAFFCQQPGKLGGETGLLNDVKVYAALPDELKRKLEDRACVAGFYAVTDMVAHYGVSADLIEEFCNDIDLPISEIDGARYVTLCKPNVIEHPITHERSLQINFNAIYGLKRPLVRAFLPDYAGLPWLVHRAHWKYPWLVGWSNYPALRRVRLAAKQGRGSYLRRPESCTPDAHTVNAIFSQEEVQMLAASMRRYYSSFPWKRGDVLVLDNLKIAHAGMAGIGKRELKAMMCNPLVLSVPVTSPGLRIIRGTMEISTGLAARLSHLKEAVCA